MSKYNYDDILKWYVTFENMLAATQQFAPIHNHLQTSDDDKKSLAKMQRRHFLLRQTLFFHNHDVDNLLICLNAFQNQILGIPPIAEGEEAQVAKQLPPLLDTGYTYLPPLSQNILKDMYNYMAAQPVYADPKNRTDDSLVHRDSVRQNHHVGIFNEHAVTNCPHFLDLVLSPNVLQTVGKMMGATPTLISLDAWWSFKGRKAPTEAQHYHMDIDDHRFVKLFIYLTDVDMDAGPHTYIPGTHNRQKIIQLLTTKANEYPEIVKWYITQLRKTDEEIQNYINIPEDYILGEAGSCFLVDTSGLHKGFLPKSKDRLLMQATFACTPAKTTLVDPLILGTTATSNISPDILTPPNDYITRLFVNRT